MEEQIDMNEIKIKIYDKRYVKLNDIFENGNINNELFNTFLRGKTYPIIDKISYIYLIDFERFCYINNLKIENILE